MLKQIRSFFTRQPSEWRNQPAPTNDWSKLLGLNNSQTTITPSNAYQLLIVKACVEVISDRLAALSGDVFKKTAEGRETIDGHRVANMLKNPNDIQTGFVFRQTLQSFPLVHGNGYAWIDNNQLWLLDPQKTEPKFSNGVHLFETEVNGKRTTLAPHEVFHLIGLGNGIKGMSPIKLAESTLSLAAATVEFGKSFYENGCTVGGIISHPGKLKDETARKNLLDRFNWKHRGARNAFKLALLEEGGAYSPLGIPPEAAQFLETRKFSDTQIASQLFKVPLHMLGLEASNVSIEQKGIEFVQNTLMPWVKRWEQEINRKLFTEKEKREGYYWEFNLDSELRADVRTATDCLNVKLNSGVINVNEWRELQNLSNIGPIGDYYRMPLNMGLMLPNGTLFNPAAQAATPVEAAPATGPEPLPEGANPPILNPNTDQKVRAALIAKAAKYLVTKEVKTLANAVKRNLVDGANLDGFADFAARSYTGKLNQALRQSFDFLGSDLDEFAADYIAQSESELANAIESEAPKESIQRLLDQWKESRAEQITNLLTDKDR